MGQKVNPISNRLGVIRGWDSNWYGGKKYGDTLLEDSKIRKYLHTRLAKASVSRIIIERTLKMATVTICTSRPGMIIGKGGKDVDALKEELNLKSNKQNAKSGLILGILGILFSWTVIIGLIFGGIGLLCAPWPKSTGGKPKAPFITCCVALFLSLLSVVMFVIAINS